MVEDWESSAGYIPQAINVNEGLSGGGKTKEDYPAWDGIDAGLERLTGLLGFMEEYFKFHTATSVTVPLGVIDDLLSRLMSVAPPTSKSDHSNMRLHPGITREEREGLWAGLPAIHTAVMSLYSTMISRFGDNFVSLAQGAWEHIVWTFRTSKEDEVYRTTAYSTLIKLLPLCGSALPKASVDRFSPVLRTIYAEVTDEDEKAVLKTQKDIHGKAITNGVANADSFLRSTPILTHTSASEPAVKAAAKAILPLLYTHLAQQNLEAYLRAEMDRTAILTHHKEAMIASVMNPFLGKNGKSLSSILPHLCRAFPRDATVEALLRPRMPVIRQSGPVMNGDFEEPVEEEDEVMGDLNTIEEEDEVMGDGPMIAKQLTSTETKAIVEEVVPKVEIWGTNNATPKKPLPTKKVTRSTTKNTVATLPAPVVAEAEDDSDDESVHLEAGLSESEAEEDEE